MDPNRDAKSPDPRGTDSCPVCGMDVDPADGPPALEYRGESIRFCNTRCRTRFRDRPGYYLAGRSATSLTPVVLA